MQLELFTITAEEHKRRFYAKHLKILEEKRKQKEVNEGDTFISILTGEVRPFRASDFTMPNGDK